MRVAVQFVGRYLHREDDGEQSKGGIPGRAGYDNNYGPTYNKRHPHFCRCLFWSEDWQI